jgi:RNA polymerase sigma factor (TIGR02999 family)
MPNSSEPLPSKKDGEELAQVPSDQLLPLVYEELRRLAAAKMAQESPGNTLQATALVHEAWIRLNKHREQQWENRAHFFGAAAEAMRRILIDRARGKQTAKRGGGWQRLDVSFLDESPAGASEETLLDVSEALEELEKEDPKVAQFVKLRFFAGLTVEEAALALEVSDRTGRRYWRFARAWLLEHFNDANASREHR